jgi:2-iminobutanoate/2-iminopropanoate deaminase
MGSPVCRKVVSMKKSIITSEAPAAIGPYSQGIRAGGFVFVSGQLPIDPATGAFSGEAIADQTRQSLANIRAILAEEGLSMEDVVKTTVLLKNISDFAAMNEVYATFFPGEAPARAAFEVAAIPKGALVEIEAIAYAGE